jgi:peptidoglycan/LPS O-acetylase OafA/YrhL
MKRPRNIPSLDGLRAISILIVIWAHSMWALPASIRDNSMVRLAVGNGANGVAVFFVISGYLITTLLLKEFDKTGAVSLGRFYFRRAMRIFPPFYAYLCVLGGLWASGILPQHRPSFIASATYMFALFPFGQGFTIFHTWSLSIEELFYLLWPLTLLLANRRRNSKWIALGLISAMPAIRLALYFFVPTLRGHEGFMVQGWIDTMMVGCLLAIVNKNPQWVAWRERYLRGWVATILAVLYLLGTPAFGLILPHRTEAFYSVTIARTAAALCIGGVMVYLIDAPDSFAGRFLNSPALRHVGILSYSLYLWQQLFVHEDNVARAPFPFNLLCCFVCAEISYFIIERPFLKLRDAILSRRVAVDAGCFSVAMAMFVWHCLQCISFQLSG